MPWCRIMNLHGVAGPFRCIKSECSAKNNAGFGQITTFSAVNMKEKSVLLTSNVSEVDGLSVGVEQLDDRVVVVFHPAADDGRLALGHRDIIRHQVLTLHCKPEKTHTRLTIQSNRSTNPIHFHHME